MKQLEEFFQRKIRIAQAGQNKIAISFPMYKIRGGLYEIYLVTEGGNFFLSDEGKTMAELDIIFDLSEPEVQKILTNALKQFGCKKTGQTIKIECSPQDIHVKFSFLIQALSFILNMRIFYV
jgi:hypothetical protein